MVRFVGVAAACLALARSRVTYVVLGDGLPVGVLGVDLARGIMSIRVAGAAPSSGAQVAPDRNDLDRAGRVRGRRLPSREIARPIRVPRWRAPATLVGPAAVFAVDGDPGC